MGACRYTHTKQAVIDNFCGLSEVSCRRKPTNSCEIFPNEIREIFLLSFISVCLRLFSTRSHQDKEQQQDAKKPFTVLISLLDLQIKPFTISFLLICFFHTYSGP